MIDLERQRERAGIFAESRNLSIKKFEEACGLSNGTVSKAVNGFSKRNLEKISKAFPELNIDWLVNGNGSMLVSGNENDDACEDEYYVAENEFVAVKQRLIAYLEHHEISKKKFGESIGASQSFVSAIRSSISPDKLTKILDLYPDLNIVWLLTGRENMIRNQETIIPKHEKEAVSPYNIHHNDTVQINAINDKLESIQKELEDLKSERKTLLTIIENLSK